MKFVMRTLIWTVIVIAAIYAAKTFIPSNIMERWANFGKQPATIGAEEMQRARFDQAEAAFSKAVESNPHDSDANYSLGWSLQSQGKDDEALRAYKTALDSAMRDKMLSTAENIHLNTGAIFMKRRQYSKAEGSFRQAVKLNPESADTEFQLGMSLAAQKKNSEAKNEFEAALKINPKYLAARNQIQKLALNDEPVVRPAALKQKRDRSPASHKVKKTVKRS